MRFHCVVNPYGGRALKAWREVQSILRAKGIEHSVHFPMRTYVVHDIVRDLSDVSDDAENVYIIIGGDGTLSVAVNGIMNFNKTYLGLIPAGSGNNFVHSNSISGTYEDIIERITDVSRVLSLDMGVLTYNTCLMIKAERWILPQNNGISIMLRVLVLMQMCV
ncbi:diacylglycerol/lipid kinase family protein [Alloscardovia sp. HMSC034E08]|uniref:diacylglycerol/lipid kinase family protein n=1 Tax=Alloscardovia sp. HMSC034E08 TaxID=1739413 RepID=UPI0008BD61F0|nr:acylglycerol kinase family protein [Alloscardovia sp. HMSC034E08]OFR00024.1 hypothetical protein HMPREF2909_05940 [Alloscardovia sp. HMSC034E08]